MRSQIINSIRFGILLLLAASCSKEKQLDQDLLSLNGASGAFSYLQTGNIVYLNGNGYSLNGNYLGMPIKLNEAAAGQDTVIATVDPSLVAVYNSLHHENNPQFPVAAFGVSHLGVFPVSAGETQLKDSLYVTLDNGIALTDNTVYLVPVRLTAKGKSKVTAPTIYFKVRFNVAQLNVSMQGATLLQGMIISRLDGGTLSVFCNNGCPDSLKFSVKLNTAFPIHETDVQATLMPQQEVDSLVEANYVYAVPMPSQTYSMTKSTVKISGGSLVSRDSIIVRFANKELLTSGRYNYMGLKLIQYTNSAYGVAPTPRDSAKMLLRVLVE